MTMYLCYDVRGIQSFLFAVPRLKYIVGGSALIDRFDRETVPSLAERHRAALVFAGGGRGAFSLSADTIPVLERALVEEAHAIGLDLRLGASEDFSEASHSADRLFPYLPPGSDLDGHPCRESGLYPVRGEGDGVHPLIRRREYSRGDRFSRYFDERVLADLDLSIEGVTELEFFHDVDPETIEGRAGSRALGSRNRWAIVCMDGNDIGAHFRVKSAEGLSGDALANWIREMSASLDRCSLRATLAGVRAVVARWREGSPDDAQFCLRDGRLLLPVRPLVVGGDDLTVLVHARHAMDFVRAACDAFTIESQRFAKESGMGAALWPATGGSLTISAGVLFCPTSLPLSSAVPYAEALLASAKSRGRLMRKEGAPSPSMVDWESVTEGFIDHPFARRQRELTFLDDDLNGERIELTMRPYTLDGLNALIEYAGTRFREIPRSIWQRVLPGLRAGRWDREIYRARLRKRHPALAKDLEEPSGEAASPGRSGRWTRVTENGQSLRRTDVIDALSLLEESARMEWETA